MVWGLSQGFAVSRKVASQKDAYGRTQRIYQARFWDLARGCNANVAFLLKRARYDRLRLYLS